MEASRVRFDDRLNIAKVEPLVILPKPRGLNQQQVVGTQPHTRTEKKTPAPAGQLAIFLAGLVHGHAPVRTLATVYQMNHTHAPPCATATSNPTTKRHRFRRTRLIGCRHFMTARAMTAGAERRVSGQMTRSTNGIANAHVSYSMRDVSEFA